MEILKRLPGEPLEKSTVEGWLGQPPRLVLVDLAKQCNLWCELHCGYPGQQLRREEKLKKGEKVEPLFIDVNVLKKAFQEIASTWNPHPSIQISADGEPLLHPRREEAIISAKEAGLNVGLTTNGVLLAASLVEKLSLAEVNLINISLDAATKETYGIVRPERSHRFNYFERVVTNIREGVRTRDKILKGHPTPTQFMITMILRKESLHEQDDFIKLGQDLGVDKVSFRPLNTTAGLTPFAEMEQAAQIHFDENGRVVALGEVQRYACHFPFTRFSLSIADQGSLKFVFCPHAWDRNDADIGLYPQDGSLKELWSSPVLEKVRAAHLSLEFDPQSICARCPDWRFVSGKDQITYANIVESTTKS